MSDGQQQRAEQYASLPIGVKWGEAISKERQQELQGYLDRWAAEADHGERKGPFDRDAPDALLGSLTGADIFWLCMLVMLEAAHDEDADLKAIMQGVRFHRLHLEGANLREAHLEGANFREAHLEGAELHEAHLEGAHLFEAHLEGAHLNSAHLEGAFLNSAHLEGAGLGGVHLEGARLFEAHLEGADLSAARLEGAHLESAHLEGADLRNASFDKTSHLNGAVLTDAQLDQTIFDNTDLSVVPWGRVLRLGEERIAQQSRDEKGQKKPPELRRDEYEDATCAYQRLATTLRAQGLSEEADYYTYRAKVMKRRLLWRQHRLGAYLLSGSLALMAGYGYRIQRIFAVYGLTVAVFAALFLIAGISAGHTALSFASAADAAQISLNAIHGRVFFAQFNLDTLQSWLATIESIFGIVIEGVFVAMLIQLFFGR
jgi:uncharacterized protein YjbI with pentapeptide repeats